MTDSLVQLIRAVALKALTPRIPTWTYATVTGTSPLRVRLDAETTPLPASPRNQAGPLAVGDRVEIRRVGKSATITRRIGDTRRFESGTAVVPAIGGQMTSVYVDLPAGLFTKIPNVTVTAVSAWPGTRLSEVTTSARSADGFQINLLRTDTANTSVDWIAAQSS